MNYSESLSAPSRRTRTRWIVLLSLAVLSAACAAFVVRRPLRMAAPSCMAGRWHGCLDTENRVVFMMFAALPLAMLVVWALAGFRRTVGVASAWRMSLAEVGMVYG